VTNNDILRRLRYTFEFNDNKMVAIFASVDVKVSPQQVNAWLKKEEEPSYIPMEDHQLAAFLNGFINEKRGKKDGAVALAEQRLNNNIILTKLKIALNLKAQDIIALLASVGISLSKPELSAFSRKPDHKHYRQCKEQVLRNFMFALQNKYRRSPAPKARQEQDKTANKQDLPKQYKPAKANASKRYDNPKAAQKLTPAKPGRKVLKLKD
jgi:uncharacterized protein YehS (DUF1456 family)